MRDLDCCATQYLIFYLDVRPRTPSTQLKLRWLPVTEALVPDDLAEKLMTVSSLRGVKAEMSHVGAECRWSLVMLSPIVSDLTQKDSGGKPCVTSVTIILFEKSFRQTSLSFKQIFL